MAVPAHDERDFEFAKKKEIEIYFKIIPEKLYNRLIKALSNEDYRRKD